MREWVNGKTALVGPGNLLASGAFLHEQASPQTGAYAVVARTQGGGRDVVAEQDTNLAVCGCSLLVYSMSQQAASTAAAALASAIENLTGCPEPCGQSGVTVLVADQMQGPVFVPMPADGGEQFCYMVSADFTLAQM